MSSRYIRFFKEIGIHDVPLVGGKNASLGELYCELTPKGIHVPNGFAVTAEAYRYVLDQAQAWDELRGLLDGLDPDDVSDIARRAEACRKLIAEIALPTDLHDEIQTAYQSLLSEYGPELTVAVRSSATAEDLPTASFAGQHETFLNVRGEDLIHYISLCFSSIFTDRAIRYRHDNGFDDLKVYNSVGVMKMVRSDLSASGVIFTLDTESGFRDVVFITGAYGLGENVVQGAVDPDEFYVFKPTFKQGKRAILRRGLGSKRIRMVYTLDGSHHVTGNEATSEEERRQFCVADHEVLKLAEYAIAIEDHYSATAGESRPMDIEWAKDGISGRLYIVQARPETAASRRQANALEEYQLKGTAPVRVTGRAVGTRIAAGRARVIHSVAQLSEFRPGEVLVADATTPDWGTVMKTAAAIVTNRGGRTCHAAIVARELGIPAIVGTDAGTETLNTGEEITVSCAEGEVGKVYAGAVPFEILRTDLSELAQPATHIMLNVGSPEIAFGLSFLPNDGVGLARMEFIITEYIKVHPMALIKPERVTDPEARAQIARLTHAYARPADFFVERLAEGVGTIAAAFYPKPVVVRLSDFKSNEYASLIGGAAFEPKEENPMLGFRGAARYTHPAYAAGFALECAAMRRVREDMGLTNVKLMVPFCRRVEEAARVIERMAQLGLKRGVNGLEIYVMCEIPNNVILIDQFSQYFDGFSIGSNDLTQLTLGVDRDSELVAFDYDERDEGVKEMLRLAVEGAKRNGRHSGICGQAPSDYPEMAELLVRLGIDSISLNPDSVLKTTQRILDLERELGRSPRTKGPAGVH